jgi:hypothetical protein
VGCSCCLSTGQGQRYTGIQTREKQLRGDPSTLEMTCSLLTAVRDTVARVLKTHTTVENIQTWRAGAVSYLCPDDGFLGSNAILVAAQLQKDIAQWTYNAIHVAHSRFRSKLRFLQTGFHRDSAPCDTSRVSQKYAPLRPIALSTPRNEIANYHI